MMLTILKDIKMKTIILFLGLFVATYCNAQIFVKQPVINECDTLTAALAEDIYDALINRNGKESIVFTLDQYSMCNIKQVVQEVRLIESEANRLITENPTLGAAAMMDSIATWSIMPLAKVGNDIIDYNPTYDVTRNFQRYRNWILTGNDVAP